MKSFIFALLFALSSLAFAKPLPSVGPDGCLAIAQDTYATVLEKAQGVKLADQLDWLKTIPVEMREIYAKMIKSVYNSDEPDAEKQAMAFYQSCMAHRGDLEQVFGTEI